MPDQILSDQGRDFQSQLMSELMELLDIHQLRTSPYHPETDGITERFNRTLKEALTHFVNEAQTDWEKYLNYIAFAYNTAEHATTQFTPYELMYGRLPKIPIDLFYGA